MWQEARIMKLHLLTLRTLALVVPLVVIASARCERPPECTSTTDCGSERFCCQGICRPDEEIGDRCGCGPAVSASPGQDCSALDDDVDALCIVSDGALPILRGYS